MVVVRMNLQAVHCDLFGIGDTPGGKKGVSVDSHDGQISWCKTKSAFGMKERAKRLLRDQRLSCCQSQLQVVGIAFQPCFQFSHSSCRVASALEKFRFRNAKAGGVWLSLQAAVKLVSCQCHITGLHPDQFGEHDLRRLMVWVQLHRTTKLRFGFLESTALVERAPENVSRAWPIRTFVNGALCGFRGCERLSGLSQGGGETQFCEAVMWVGFYGFFKRDDRFCMPRHGQQDLRAKK